MKQRSLTDSGKRTAGDVLAAALAVLALTAFVLAGCDTSGGDTPNEWNSVSLVNAVYGGTNPGGAWVTVTFRGDGKMIGAFSGDNTSSEWEYTCDEGNGGITSGGWNPGAFTVSGDGAALTFTDFGGHGEEIILSRLRAPDLTAADSPANLAALDTNLAGSVWGGTTPAGEGTSWLTLTFRAKRTSTTGSGAYEAAMDGTTVAVISYAHDNTTAVWEYSYDASAKAGTGFTNGHKPDGTGTGWNPGAYTIGDDGETIIFTSFMGQSRTFKRYFPLAAE